MYSAPHRKSECKDDLAEEEKDSMYDLDLRNKVSAGMTSQTKDSENQDMH